MPLRFPSLRSTTRRNDAVVALDLSPGRFKVVALAAGADGPELLAVVDEASDGSSDRRFDPARVANRLRKTLDTMGVSPREVALALGPGEAVVRRLAVVPQAREATLAALALQLAPALGPDLATPRVDFVALQAGASGGRVSVLAAAGRPDAIAAQRRAVSDAGCEPGAVVPTAAALTTVWRELGPRVGADRVLLLHVGESAVLWMVVEDGEPVALDAPLVGVASLRDRGATRRGPGGELQDAAPDALAEWVARIRQEVQRGLQAARRETGQSDPPGALNVWLCGGGARVAGLADALSSALGAPVYVFDPVLALGGDADEGFGPALAPTIGAALQAMSRDGAMPGLDLRPPAAADEPGGGKLPLPALGRRVARDGAFRLAAVAALAGMLVAGAAGVRQAAADGTLSRREAQVAADSSRVATAISQSQALASRRSALGTAVDQLRVLERGRDLWPRVLDAVAIALPGTAWVSGIAEEREDPASGAVTLRVRGYAPSDVVASAFERRLAEIEPGLHAAATQARAVRIGTIDAVQFELAAEARTDSAEVVP